jgi:hypothetical protein
MRTALLVLSGLVVFSGVISIRLWSNLRAERQLNADLTAQLAEAKMPSREATTGGLAIAAEPPAVITAVAVPERVAAPIQPATSMNQLRADVPLRNEPPNTEQPVVEPKFAVNQTGKMRAKPSTIISGNDLNNDGVVTKEEAERAGKALIRLWNVYDLNKDGMVDDAELTRASGL